MLLEIFHRCVKHRDALTLFVFTYSNSLALVVSYFYYIYIAHTEVLFSPA